MTLTIPDALASAPRDAAGRPIPWFVALVNGTPDFRLADSEKLYRAVKESRCWVCGRPLFGLGTFVVGPMCVVNHNSAEPPGHKLCARYSATACPFLSNPEKMRRETHMPAERYSPAGTMIRRNPGVTAVYTSRAWKAWSPPGGGVLFDIGEPSSVEWYVRGREATRDEVLASIDSGCPALRDIATEEGPDAVAQLERQLVVARTLIPA